MLRNICVAPAILWKQQQCTNTAQARLQEQAGVRAASFCGISTPPQERSQACSTELPISYKKRRKIYLLSTDNTGENTGFLWHSRGICLVGKDAPAEQLCLAHIHGQWLGLDLQELKTSHNQQNNQEKTFSRSDAPQTHLFFLLFSPLPLVLH